MVNIRLYSPYDKFNHTKSSKYINWVKEGHTDIECYYDANVLQAKNDGIRKFALLIEPRGVLQDSVYDFILYNYSLFEYVFSHDEEILEKVPNARPINFANIWYSNPDIPKTKGISMVCSDKKMTDIHIVRQQIADELKEYVDLYGSYVSDEWTPYEQCLDGYKFAIVVENYINDYWFTEKIANCFANRVIPIYYGARKINDYFDSEGIIIVNPNNIKDIVSNLDIEKEYEKRKKSIERNLELVQQYEVFEDWFFLEYKDLLKI